MRTFSGFFYAACFFAILTAAFPACSQTISWEIKKHAADAAGLKGEITSYMENGFIPVGMTFDGTEIYVMYIKGVDMTVSAWALEWYESVEEIEARISENISQGYVPYGVTFTGQNFYVLYLNTGEAVRSWKLIPSGAGLSEVQAALQPFIAQGYVPYGITFYQDAYWTLVLAVDGSPVRRWLLESYEIGGHDQNINAAIERGYLPWGLEYSGTSRLDVLYVGF